MQKIARDLFGWLLKAEVINNKQYRKLEQYLGEEIKREIDARDKMCEELDGRPWWERIFF